MEKRDPPTLLVKMQVGAATAENSIKGPQKSKNRITIRPSNPIPGCISGEKHNLKRYMHPNVHCNTVYNNQDIEATQISTDGGMDKKDAVYKYIYVYI